VGQCLAYAPAMCCLKGRVSCVTSKDECHVLHQRTSVMCYIKGRVSCVTSKHECHVLHQRTSGLQYTRYCPICGLMIAHLWINVSHMRPTHRRSGPKLLAVGTHCASCNRTAHMIMARMHTCARAHTRTHTHTHAQAHTNIARDVTDLYCALDNGTHTLSHTHTHTAGERKIKACA